MAEGKRLQAILQSAVVCIAANASVITAACGQEADAGRLEYNRNCAACHGVTGAGDGPVSAFLVTKTPDLRRMKLANGGRFPRIEAHELIDGRYLVGAHGSKEMPIWGDRFSAEAVRAARPEVELDAVSIVRGRITRIVDFLESIQRDR